MSYPTFVLDKGVRHWLRQKHGAVCVCVLQGSSEVVCAFCEKLNCFFQNKRGSLCTNTTGGGFPFSRALLKPFKQSLNKCHHSPSHTQIVSMSFCLSPTHTHTHSYREPSSQGMESRTTLLSKKLPLWTPNAREKNEAEKKESLSLRGIKLFLCYGLS